jgi:hypothetical protein
VSIGGWQKAHQVVEIGGLQKDYQYSIDQGHKRTRVKGRGKYSAINFRYFDPTSTHLAEFRIFAGVNGPTDIARFSQFVHAACVWSTPVSATGSSSDYRHFLEWLAARDEDYPTLAEYLRQSQFRLNDGLIVTSDWQGW